MAGGDELAELSHELQQAERLIEVPAPSRWVDSWMGSTHLWAGLTAVHESRYCRSPRYVARALTLQLPRKAVTMTVALAHQPTPTGHLALTEAGREAVMRRQRLVVIHVVAAIDLDNTEAFTGGITDEITDVVAEAGLDDLDWRLELTTAKDDSGVADAVLDRGRPRRRRAAGHRRPPSLAGRQVPARQRHPVNDLEGRRTGSRRQVLNRRGGTDCPPLSQGQAEWTRPGVAADTASASWISPRGRRSHRPPRSRGLAPSCSAASGRIRCVDAAGERGYLTARRDQCLPAMPLGVVLRSEQRSSIVVDLAGSDQAPGVVCVRI